MLQFSLRNLLVTVAAVAVGTAALLNANSWWVSLLWATVFLMLGIAGFVAYFWRESQRAFWGGCLVAGSLYLLLLIYSVPQMSSTNTWMTALWLLAPQTPMFFSRTGILGIHPVSVFC